MISPFGLLLVCFLNILRIGVIGASVALLFLFTRKKTLRPSTTIKNFEVPDTQSNSPSHQEIVQNDTEKRDDKQEEGIDLIFSHLNLHPSAQGKRYGIDNFSNDDDS